MIPKNITREHVLSAIREIDEDGVRRGRDSKEFKLLHQGWLYPPKYVISLANRYANGEELAPSEFNGGRETNDYLKRLGFEIMEVHLHDKGPLAYENWRAQVAGDPSKMAYEYPLFTDANVSGEMSTGCGPYQVLKTVASPSKRVLLPALVLRLEDHLVVDPLALKMGQTDAKRYHGGGQSDEIAALLALCLGIRLKSGGRTRRFYPKGDPKGRPEAWGVQEDPVLIKPRSHLPVLPQALGRHCLTGAAILTRLPNLLPRDAVALVKAARLYQEAVWIADSEPELSWILLVSAAETAAGRWRASKESPLERLRASKPGPELESILRRAGGEEHVLKVADLIAPYMGATRKFIDFILEHMPEPPEKRPLEVFQHPWDRRAMKKSMGRIYDWRSGALHGGIPFPLPMCDPPVDGEEKPIGLATGGKGGVWIEKDTPMLLHIFEYIIRNALLKWWGSMPLVAKRAA